MRGRASYRDDRVGQCRSRGRSPAARRELRKHAGDRAGKFVKATQDLDLARQVQAQLLPQRRPPLRTLAYDGYCLQVGAFGGDYYDFLDLSHGRVGLVLADISGKGIAAALRSLTWQVMQNLPRC